jgi:hypothetical protein
MELRTHHIMVVTRHCADWNSSQPHLSGRVASAQLTQRSVLPIPYSDCLIVGGREDPRKFAVEEYRSHVVEMSVQGEKTSPGLKTPDLNLVVVTSGDKEGLCRVEINAANRSIVLFKAIDQRSHAIIP